MTSSGIEPATLRLVAQCGWTELVKIIGVLSLLAGSKRSKEDQFVDSET
jgi:hypothetical protein